MVAEALEPGGRRWWVVVGSSSQSSSRFLRFWAVFGVVFMVVVLVDLNGFLIDHFSLSFLLKKHVLPLEATFLD